MIVLFIVLVATVAILSLSWVLDAVRRRAAIAELGRKLRKTEESYYATVARAERAKDQLETSERVRDEQARKLAALTALCGQAATMIDQHRQALEVYASNLEALLAKLSSQFQYSCTERKD
jgi:hypothetical protein